MPETRRVEPPESQWITSMSWAPFCSSRLMAFPRSACQSLK